MIKNNTKNKSKIESVIERYEEEKARLSEEIHRLNYEVNRMSTSAYPAGIPDLRYNRGDEGDAFSFPINWATTAKQMSKSPYLEPILSYYRALFNSFNYKISLPDEYKNNEKLLMIHQFLEDGFNRAGGLKRFIVEIAYQTLIFGFSFYTSKLAVTSGEKYGFKGKLDILDGIKFYDPTKLYSFTFNEDDSDELQSVDIFTSQKVLGGKSTELYADYLNRIKSQEKIDLITIDFDALVGGYCSYDTIPGDPIGKSFLYSLYPDWLILENMNNSFNRNLSNIGEHSFNIIPHPGADLSDSTARETTKRELREFINSNKGGVFIGSYGTIQKIEGIDANEWYNYRTAMVSDIYKAKGLDIKSLGLNRGATRDLAEINQSDSVVTALDLIDNFIRQINSQFIKRLFDLNFKEYRLLGIEPPKVEVSYLEEKAEQVVNTEKETLSAVKTTTILSDGSKQVELTDGKNVVKKTTAIPLNKFVKRELDGIESYVIDTTELENILVRSSNDMNTFLQTFVRQALQDDKLIEKAIKHPSSFIRGKLLSNEQRQELIRVLEAYIRSDLIEFYGYKAKEIARGLGTTELTSIFNKSVNEWVEDQVKFFMKNKVHKLTDDIAANVEKKAVDLLFNNSRGLEEADIQLAKDFVKSKLMDVKGKSIESFVDNETVTIFQEVNNDANEYIKNKTDGVVILRSGVLENMCSHCQKYFGVMYTQDSEGNWYNADYPYISLPDKDCKGGASNCKCYYTTISENVLNVLNNLTKSF